eukprot:scaffold154498_cov56-Attheya_sp.AAC.1
MEAIEPNPCSLRPEKAGGGKDGSRFPAKFVVRNSALFARIAMNDRSRQPNAKTAPIDHRSY